MADEGLHEIQLNGKQLVFLFMTATVVAVVIFLCGVMVGRGVPAQRATPVLATDGADPTNPEVSEAGSSASDSAAPATAAANPTASPSAGLGLQYSERLEHPEPVAENLTASGSSKEPFSTAVATAPPAPARTDKAIAPAKPDKSGKNQVSTRVEPAKAPVERKRAASAPTDIKPSDGPAGSGFVVQVAAVRQRGEADVIRGRLARKGYPAFVTTARTAGAPTYRVRVGKYTSKQEADSVAAKLEREEQFKTWVTR